MFRFVKQMLHNSEGTSTIELAVVFPVGMVLMLGAVDTSMGFAEKLRVETAAARAVEQVTAYSRVQTNYSLSRSEAAAAANVPVTDVTVTNWLECNDEITTPFTGTCPNSSDQIARFVRVAVRGKFEPSLNFRGFLNTDADGFVRMEGDSSVRIQ